MSEICIDSVTVTTTGSAGSATGTGTSAALNGELLAIRLDFHASAPGATTDTTISYTDLSGNILVVTDSATDAWFYPRATAVTNANVAITNSHDRFPLCGKLTVSVAQCNALTGAVVAHIVYKRG